MGKYKYYRGAIYTMRLILLILSLLIINSCEDFWIVEGCTTNTACNYNAEASKDDGSCEYSQENYDCDGNCVLEGDNLGVDKDSSVVRRIRA